MGAGRAFPLRLDSRVPRPCLSVFWRDRPALSQAEGAGTLIFHLRVIACLHQVIVHEARRGSEEASTVDPFPSRSRAGCPIFRAVCERWDSTTQNLL
jgi:hypothetical protein